MKEAAPFPLCALVTSCRQQIPSESQSRVCPSLVHGYFPTFASSPAPALVWLCSPVSRSMQLSLKTSTPPSTFLFPKLCLPPDLLLEKPQHHLQKDHMGANTLVKEQKFKSKPRVYSDTEIMMLSSNHCAKCFNCIISFIRGIQCYYHLSFLCKFKN